MTSLFEVLFFMHKCRLQTHIPFSSLPVVLGSIRNVSHDSGQQTSMVEVHKGRVYRQRSGVFEREPDLSGSWHGHIQTLLQCGVKAGAGQFLFTGSELFGEARLGCAPRFKDFQILYHSAKRTHQMPCDFSIDWGEESLEKLSFEADQRHDMIKINLFFFFCESKSFVTRVFSGSTEHHQCQMWFH